MRAIKSFPNDRNITGSMTNTSTDDKPTRGYITDNTATVQNYIIIIT